MAGAEGRSTLPDVVVDSAQVQESPAKDTIIVDIPDEVGQFDTVLVRRVTDKIKVSSAAWAEYAKQQDHAEIVKPLMVLQVPNTPDPNDRAWARHDLSAVAGTDKRGYRPRIGRAHYADFRWTRCATYLPRTCAGIELGARAYSEGCHQHRVGLPQSRGDGLFPSGQDRTHITQLLGRMVRRHSPDAFPATIGSIPWTVCCLFSMPSRLWRSPTRHEGWRGRRRHATDRASGADATPRK